VKKSTRGIVFLGTPHRGANLASYGEMLVTITKAVGLGSDKALIHSLRDRSPELFKMATYFSDIYEAFELFCFYELEPWRYSSLVSDIGEPSTKNF
jgi:protein SERAC1